jgi:hypothetical protein
LVSSFFSNKTTMSIRVSSALHILVLVAPCLLLLVGSAEGFSSALFQETPAAQLTFPSKTNGVEIELPNFDELFSRIQDVSPLARAAIAEGGFEVASKGFQGIGKPGRSDG